MALFRLAGTLALVATLGACATLDRADQATEQVGPGPCRARVCVLMVTVRDCVATVDDPEKVVPRENRRPTLRFRLDDASKYRFAFTPDGIAFKSDPAGQFRLLGRTLLAEHFDIIDINDAPGRFEYRVKVTRRFGALCPTVDPFIINN